MPAVPLVASYEPPAGDRLGDRIRNRSWTYDCALTATALAVRGDLDGAGAILDRLQELQRPDGALDGSFDLAGRDPAGPLRSGNQAWVGLAALATGSSRYERLLAGLARWLLDQRGDDGLVRGGPDVSWVSTEHNLEARALFAALGATDVVAGMDSAIDARLFAGDHFRQGAGDDARPLDVQFYGMLWLIGRGRRADAAAVERTTDATMRVDGRRVLWSGAAGQTFSGYRPFADRWGPDVLWMEGTLMMRLAKARLGSDVGDLDDSADRWAALTAPHPPLQVDRARGGDYHVWPAAAPAAWRTLCRSEFALLQAG
jgi:hypothetical protein